jgi:hypothetical protein
MTFRDATLEKDYCLAIETLPEASGDGRKPSRTIMIQRDYILRMIEELRSVLAAIVAYREEGRWQKVAGTVDEQFRRMVGVGASEAASLSETELTARLMRGEATQVVRDKMLFLIRLFKEAGDAAVAQDRLEEGHDLLLKGLELRVGTYWGEEPSAHADFATPVEAFTGALAGTSIPPRTQAMLMHHYERMGAFAKAEDALYALLEAAPDDTEVLDWGINFYERSQRRGDSDLQAGNLPRSELDVGLAELKARKAACRG